MPAQSDPILFEMSAENGVTITTSVIADSVQMGRSANFSLTGILNRSAPIVTYANTNALMVSMTLYFCAEKDAKKEVVDPVRAMFSLVLPMVPGIVPPPVCHITLYNGSMLKRKPAVVINVDSTIPNTIYAPGGEPMLALVPVQFLVMDLQNVASAEWLSGAATIQQLALGLKR